MGWLEGQPGAAVHPPGPCLDAPASPCPPPARSKTAMALTNIKASRPEGEIGGWLGCCSTEGGKG